MLSFGLRVISFPSPSQEGLRGVRAFPPLTGVTVSSDRPGDLAYGRLGQEARSIPVVYVQLYFISPFFVSQSFFEGEDTATRFYGNIFYPSKA